MSSSKERPSTDYSDGSKADKLALAVRQKLNAMPIGSKEEFQALRANLEAILTSDSLSSTNIVLIESILKAYAECQTAAELKRLDDEIRAHIKNNLLLQNIPVEPKSVVFKKTVSQNTLAKDLNHSKKSPKPRSV